jgi:type I restriction enzyme M protein
MPAPPTSLPDGKVLDFIDEKLRNDTPEEYVRQNIERRLVLELGFSRAQIAVEFPIKMGSDRRRVDIVIFREGVAHSQENAWVLIECKRDSVDPKAKKDGVGQLKSYMAACDGAEWGMWTNGKHKEVWRRTRTAEGSVWEEPNDIPPANGDIASVDRPVRGQLRNATDDNLLFSFRICHDHIYTTDGLQKQPAFFELLKVIFCKIHDERNVGHPLEFYATAKEKGSNDGRLTVKRRIGKIFEAVKKRYPAIFEANDAIRLEPRSLAYIVGELQRYSFLNTDIDVKGKAYEELVGANLRGDRGEFFTPRNVQQMAIRMLDLKSDERILDPSCGTGGFLVIAMNRMMERLREEAGREGDDEAVSAALRERLGEMARESFFGIDINPDLVKATKMNMVMNNDGSGNILRQDSLLHPHDWTSAFREELAAALGIDADTLRGPGDLGHFDVIATNPPFGSKLPIKDRETLEQYDLARIWQKTDGGLMEPTDAFQTSVAPEILFIERCYQFLRPGGRMAIVLPDAILGAPGLLYVRHWMLTRCRLVASVDLHPDTFQPHTGIQTSVLVLQKKTADDRLREERAGKLRDYAVFMAEVRAIGHDKRGNFVYRRDEDGEILLFKPDPKTVRRMEQTAAGTVTARPLAPEKRRDDDTGDVAEEFIAWKTNEEVLGW